MRDKSEVLTGAQKNRFGLILYIILLSVVYILITRLNLTTTYYSLYSSLDENSQVTEYFIISIATFLFWRLYVCSSFILSLNGKELSGNYFCAFIFFIYHTMLSLLFIVFMLSVLSV